VNAMDVEELRRSQRRYRAGRNSRVEAGSDEDEEDEDCSTPSAEHSDRNMASMLCVSMESVDQVGRRERFLQNTFESLSGPDDQSLHSIPTNSNSISAQQRNAGTIARQTRDADQNRRREELQRRIEETRMKLQNGPDSSTTQAELSQLNFKKNFLYFENSEQEVDQIGYRSMKGSQSINDLSSFPETSGSQGGTLPRSSRADESVGSPRASKETSSSSKSSKSSEKTCPSSSSKDGTSLRRACSLSDLNKPSVPRRILPAPPSNVSGKKAGHDRERERSVQPHRPSSSSDNDHRGLYHRRKSIDEKSDRGIERKMSTKSPGPGGPVLSRLEQHERMLAERERERRETQRLASMGRQTSKGDLRPKSVTDDSDNRDLPSYMRSTSASVKKEKMVSPPERVRRRSTTQYTQSQNDLRRIDREEETSSEDDGRGKKRSSSTDRRMGRDSPGRSGISSSAMLPGRAKSERDLSRVAKVKVSGQVREAAMQPQQIARMRTKMKTTTIISNDGAMTVSPPSQPSPPQYAVKGTEAVDVTRAPLSRQLAQRCGAKMQEAADDLVKLYKRVSLDDDLDDALRSELLSQLSAGASSTSATLRLVCGEGERSQGEIATAAMASINQFLSKQSQSSHNSQPPPSGPMQQDLSANPYFQHMIENYSNLMYQNMANQRQSSGPPPDQHGQQS